MNRSRPVVTLRSILWAVLATIMACAIVAGSATDNKNQVACEHGNVKSLE